jgi:hypothetical protein
VIVMPPVLFHETPQRRHRFEPLPVVCEMVRVEADAISVPVVVASCVGI